MLKTGEDPADQSHSVSPSLPFSGIHSLKHDHMTLARDPAFQPLAAMWQHCMFQITLNTDMRIKYLDFSSSLILSADKGIKN